MTETTLFGGLAVAHLWQSVAVAAVLAAALIFGKRLAGGTRYGLAAAAFAACLILPMASFIPGESIVRSALKMLDAPVSVRTAEEVAALKTETVAPEPAAVAPSAPSATSTTTRAAFEIARLAIRESLGLSSTPNVEVLTDAARSLAPAGTIPLPPRMHEIAPATEPAVIARTEAKPLFELPSIQLPSWFKLPDLSSLILPLILVWIAGTLMMLVRVARDLIAVERLVGRARAIDLPEALRKRMPGVRVAVSPDAPGPMAAGLFRPCVVLPESATGQLNTVGMAALLEHERAHIERRDMAVALLQRVVLALLWWSPALHWISRRIDEERELACDETAVARTGDAHAFARSLTTQAENQLWARAPRLAVGAIGPRSQFGRRIRRLIDLAKSGGSPTKYTGRLAFSGLAVAVVMAALVTPRILAQPREETPPPIDATLDGGPDRDVTRDINRVVDRDRTTRQDIKLDVDNLDDQLKGDFDGLGADIQALMDSVSEELQQSLGEISPEFDGELAGLSGELSALGAEIAVTIDQELARNLPLILEEVRVAFQEVDNDLDQNVDREELRQELREAMDELREELRQEFGPEFREHLREELEEAREEIARHREEWAEQHAAASMDIAREAVAQAREQLQRARERGDFDFDFELQHLEELRNLKNLKNLSGKDWQQFEKFNRIRVTDSSSPSRRLMSAAARGDDERVRELVAQGADVNALFPGDGTALIAAARRGETEVVRALLDAGADVNKPSPGDGNPLIAAAAGGEPEVVQLLLARGADANAYVPGDETALINAAKDGSLEVVKMLVDRGANVNLAYRADGRLRSPLNTAERYDNDDVADFLRSKGAVAEPKPAN